MNQHPLTERLSEFVDGGLPPREQTEIQTHLEACAECRDVVEDFRLLVARAATLEDHDPPADLWPGIAYRLDDRPVRGIGLAGVWGRRLAFTIPQIAAVAAVLVFLSGGGVWLAMRGMTPGQPGASSSASGPVAVGPAQAPAGPAETGITDPTGGLETIDRSSGGAARSTREPAAALAGYDLTRYDATIAELQAVLSDNQAGLDSSTVRIIQQNLTIIDRAIGDARRALMADPANPYLNGHLAQQLQRKVRLLQQATVVVAAHQS